MEYGTRSIFKIKIIANFECFERRESGRYHDRFALAARRSTCPSYVATLENDPGVAGESWNHRWPVMLHSSRVFLRLSPIVYPPSLILD